MIRPIARLSLAVVLAACLHFAHLADAALYDDPTAIVSDRVTFSIPGFAGAVDYAVFAPGSYSGSVGFPNQYVYAYQLFNDAASSVFVDYFSVGLYPDVGVVSAAYDPFCDGAVPGGIAPTSHLILSQSALFIFQSNPVHLSEHSYALLLASERAPVMGSGFISGGFTGGRLLELPTPNPVPEPSCLLLFAVGAILIRRIK